MNTISPLMQVQHMLSPSVEQAFSQVSKAQGDTFQNLAQNSRMTAPDASGQTENVVSQLAQAEDTQIQSASNDALFLMNEMPNMSVQQLSAASMQVQVEMSSLTADLQAKMSVATSTKDSIETLMKNQ
jgi:type III secretion inner rod protein HrpB2